MQVTVVTITNRKRWHLLRETLSRAMMGGADRFVVVDNESQEDISARMEETFPGCHKTIRLEPNQGSAGAYLAGMRSAIEDGAEFLLLLDDDNAVCTGTIDILKKAFLSLGGPSCLDRLAVAGYREEQEILRGSEVPNFPRHDRMLGFHITDIPRGLWKRLPWRPSTLTKEIEHISNDAVLRPIAPWGGLFFHRTLIERFGYPNPDFLLYHDDTEFTHRITAGGGAIYLIPSARIEDIEGSWQSDRDSMPYFVAWIMRGSDEQAYYQTRNRAYLETYQRPRSIMREINRLVLNVMLKRVASRAGKMDRYRLLIEAVRDGEAAILGRKTAFEFQGGLNSTRGVLRS